MTALLLLLTACAPSRTPTEPSGAPSPTEHSGTPPIESSPSGIKGTVIVVSDGDSLRVRLGGQEERVRLEGINAPEHDECWGEQARATLAELVGDGAVLLSGEGRDRFGRPLRYVYRDGELLNEILLRRGHAISLTTDHPRAAAFLAAEAAAIAAGRGLWSASACGPATDAQLVIRDLRFDAPGDDGDNPNG
ncbi:MAG: thermonuclease family protein, partial [Acidimicrobiia bacterium]